MTVPKHNSGSLRKIQLDQVSIIIPVKNNQSGIELFLKSFFETQSPQNYPREIIIVDNNSDVPLAISSDFIKSQLDIYVITCSKPGPSSARNMGVMHSTGEWLLFVDSDCIASSTLLTAYEELDASCIAYAGYVDALGKDYLSQYYISQEIHFPPKVELEDLATSPKYVITANALVWKKAFEQVGGFNETLTMAGGEDIDLGLRLSKVGQLGYAKQSVCIHNFDDGIYGFMKRFVRYGKGNRLIESLHEVSMIPLPSTAKKKSVFINNVLVVLQWVCLLTGYLQMEIEIRKQNL